jgi:hypothetical protein
MDDQFGTHRARHHSDDQFGCRNLHDHQRFVPAPAPTASPACHRADTPQPATLPGPWEWDRPDPGRIGPSHSRRGIPELTGYLLQEPATVERELTSLNSLIPTATGFSATPPPVSQIGAGMLRDRLHGLVSSRAARAGNLQAARHGACDLRPAGPRAARGCVVAPKHHRRLRQHRSRSPRWNPTQSIPQRRKPGRSRRAPPRAVYPR